jgi:hypothetical protein
LSPPPSRPRIYHITHVDNLKSIAQCDELWSDGLCRNKNLSQKQVGMSAIKARRLFELEVGCHPGTKVGDYVPFYFCPRSIMLYLFYRGNHPDLDYTEGQRPLVHLEADVHEVVQWAERKQVHWAFSDRNAGTRYAVFYKDLRQLNKVDWNAVAATDFRDSNVKEGKQAEFLVYGTFPWVLVRRIGVRDQTVAKRATEALIGGRHRPVVSVEAGWYY